MWHLQRRFVRSRATGTTTVNVTAPAPGPTPATIKLGRLKRNLANGSAILPATVSAAGRVMLTGKGVFKVTRDTTGATTVPLKVRAKGKARKKLLSTGKAKVRVQVAFTSTAGAGARLNRSLTLRRMPPRQRGKRTHRAGP